MKRLTSSMLFAAAACVLASTCRAQMMAEAAARSGGAPGSVAAMAPLGPEFGFTIEKQVTSYSVIGGVTGTYKEHTPPNVVKLEAYALDRSLPAAFRMKAVQTIATLSQYEPAIASLEKIATTDPRASARVAKEAITGLGGSQLPTAKAALDKISSGDAHPIHKKAAIAALKTIADSEQEPLGFW
jgi:hypothetical protein